MEMLVAASAQKTSSLSLIRQKGKQVEDCTEICDMVLAENVFSRCIQNGSEMIMFVKEEEKRHKLVRNWRSCML